MMNLLGVVLDFSTSAAEEKGLNLYLNLRGKAEREST